MKLQETGGDMGIVSDLFDLYVKLTSTIPDSMWPPKQSVLIGSREEAIEKWASLKTLIRPMPNGIFAGYSFTLS
jgi:hypothetical protein